MPSKVVAGQRLSREEAIEMEEFRKAELPLPSYFDDVVVDNTEGEFVFRHQTVEERKAAEEDAKEAAELAKIREKALAKVERARNQMQEPSVGNNRVNVADTNVAPGT